MKNPAIKIEELVIPFADHEQKVLTTLAAGQMIDIVPTHPISKQFYLTLLLELDEASRVDGASGLRIYWDVIMPFSGPALATVAVFGIIHRWNNFLGPLIFTSSANMRTHALGLKLLVSGGFMNTDLNWVMAASVEMLLPVLVLLFCALRYFIRGIALTGLAGR